MGLGILLSPLILPLMTTWQVGWLLLAVLSVLMTLVSYLAYGNLNEPERRNVGDGGSLRPIAPLLVAYGLYGAGYIGYMTFVTTGLSVAILPFWVVLGMGASFTGLAWGPVVERFGGEAGMALVLLCLAGSSLYPLVVALPYLSAFVFGISFLGVITAITDVFRQLLPPSGWGRAMGLSTACFAAGQAVGPSLSGLAGDLFGGPVGALGLSTGLLMVSLLVTVMTAVRLRRLR